MSEENKAIVRRWVELSNTPSPTSDQLAEVWAQSCIVRPGGGLPEVRGVQALAKLLAAFRAALPDLEVSTENLVAEGDLVAGRFMTRGTQVGPFLHFTPSGKRVAFGGFAVFRLQDGRIVEEWLLDDLFSLMNQVGASPAAHRAQVG